MGAGTEKRHSDRPAENNRPYAAERVSHTVASRETVLTVSAPTGFKSRLPLGNTPSPLKNQERTDVMNEFKNKNLFIRVSEKEKTIIEQNAKKCGLSVSEYLRQRALGYMPRAVLPEIFFSFNDKLNELCIAWYQFTWRLIIYKNIHFNLFCDFLILVSFIHLFLSLLIIFELLYYKNQLFEGTDKCLDGIFLVPI